MKLNLKQVRTSVHVVVVDTIEIKQMAVSTIRRLQQCNGFKALLDKHELLQNYEILPPTTGSSYFDQKH